MGYQVTGIYLIVSSVGNVPLSIKDLKYYQREVMILLKSLEWYFSYGMVLALPFIL